MVVLNKRIFGNVWKHLIVTTGEALLLVNSAMVENNRLDVSTAVAYFLVYFNLSVLSLEDISSSVHHSVQSCIDEGNRKNAM